MSHSARIHWTQSSGDRIVLTVADCMTRDDAQREVTDWARSAGWTPPRWWQFWRWGDTRLPSPRRLARG